MLTRFHKILIGLLVVQFALVMMVVLRHGDAGVVPDHPLLPDFDAAKVTKLTISGAEGPPVVLAKQGASWVVASAFDYPADGARISELLSPIAKLASGEPVATQPARHKQLHVDDAEFARKLVITTDKDLVLFVGGPVGHRTAIRFGGDDRVYGVSGISETAAGTEARDWIDPAYVKIPRAEVARITIGDVDIARAGASWSVAMSGAPVVLAAGETIDTGAIDRLVDEVATIDLAAPGDPKRDASKPTAVITIERTAPAPAAGSGSGSAGSAAPPGPPPPPIVLDVIADGERYWVHQRGLATAVMVDKARLESLLAVDRDKLVKKPTVVRGAGSGSDQPPPAPH